MSMTTNVFEVERALLALDHHARAAVIHHGLRSLEDERSAEVEQVEVDEAWQIELRKRIEDIESGEVELLDSDEVHAQILAELDTRTQ